MHLHGRPPIKFDVLSVDIGITPAGGGVPGADEHSTPVKPINGFSARWDSLVQRVLQSDRPMHVVVVSVPSPHARVSRPPPRKQTQGRSKVGSRCIWRVAGSILSRHVGW